MTFVTFATGNGEATATLVLGGAAEDLPPTEDGHHPSPGDIIVKWDEPEVQITLSLEEAIRTADESSEKLMYYAIDAYLKTTFAHVINRGKAQPS